MDMKSSTMKRPTLGAGSPRPTSLPSEMRLQSALASCKLSLTVSAQVSEGSAGKVTEDDVRERREVVRVVVRVAVEDDVDEGEHGPRRRRRAAVCAVVGTEDEELEVCARARRVAHHATQTPPFLPQMNSDARWYFSISSAHTTQRLTPISESSGSMGPRLWVLMNQTIGLSRLPLLMTSSS